MHGLYWFFIEPLELLFEFVFSLSYKAIDHPGICIIILSIVMNLLALPLYRRADALQKEEKEKMGELEPGIDHIKKTFKGDERYMMLNEYYRQQGYKPLYSLRSSFSLLLQVQAKLSESLLRILLPYLWFPRRRVSTRSDSGFQSLSLQESQCRNFRKRTGSFGHRLMI